MPRTNHAGVTEVASIRSDQDKYAEGWDRIFGKKNSPQGEAEDEKKEGEAPPREYE